MTVVRLRPAQCRSFVREELAKAIPTIAKEFVKLANEGSVSHLTMLSKLGGFDLRPMANLSKRGGRSSSRRLLDELRGRKAKSLASADTNPEAEPRTGASAS